MYQGLRWVVKGLEPACAGVTINLGQREYAHAGLWKVEDFLYMAAIAVPRSIDMLCTCYTCNQ
jgi:hypothetical protein